MNANTIQENALFASIRVIRGQKSFRHRTEWEDDLAVDFI